MTWILLAAGLVVAGLAVLGAAAVRVVSAARGLNREVAQINQQFRVKPDSRG
ncbi:hypothetical protein MF672_021755 [Actinomadura sp. ATCC 31491]|uniref:DUF948 domain-containing protein n=1 Tax=Actinomadura luzonensis TaxID=2805427 RepID=A0ABT0FWZ8_9ACTN|nr:hypothetical protein [Actinomadura luzonensis]MCK2216406.1 hypothetical protein [Actinomadura luzonensis]